MHPSGMTHMLHAPSVTPLKLIPCVVSMFLPWIEKMQEPNVLHYECYLVLQAIIQIVLLHEANELFQLMNM